MTQLAIITTCRGRLEHLKQSLPTFVAQPGTECIVVDYGCPDGAGDWVEQHFPAVKVVRAGEPPRFEVSRARNLGAAAAQSPWLCFVDADALLDPSFSTVVTPLLRSKVFYRPSPQTIDGTGMCIVSRQDFEAVGGYDGVLQGYGMDDRDFYQRLGMARVRQAAVPGELVKVIGHDVGLRVAHYEVKDMFLSSAINQTYCNVKWDLMRLFDKPLAEDARAALYTRVFAAVAEAHRTGTEMNLRVPVRVQKTRVKRALRTALHYRLLVPEAPKDGAG